MLTATPLYWDPSGAAVASGGSGSWNTTTAEWRSGSPTGPLVAWNNAGDTNGPMEAVFSAGSGTVALKAGIVAAAVTFASSGYAVTGQGILTLSGASGEISTATGEDTITAKVGGVVGLDKTGAGTLNLLGANSYSGGTTISAGTLDIKSDVSLGAIPSSSGANIKFAGASSLQVGASSVVIAATRGIAIEDGVSATLDTQGNSLTVNGPITNADSSGTLGKAGSNGTLILADSNAFVAGTTVDILAGTICLANSNALGTAPITLDAQGVQASAAILELTNGVKIGSNVTYLVSGDPSGHSIDLDSISGNNAFNGQISIASSGNAAIQSSKAGDTLSLGGLLTTPATGALPVLMFEGDGNGMISGAISNGAGVVSTQFAGGRKSTWTLIGSSTYSGNTDVMSGNVLVNGSLVKSRKVEVSRGAQLGGTGHIYGTVAVDGGATLAPGGAGIEGILTTGSVSLAPASTLSLSLDGLYAGTGYDQLAVNGSVSVGGALLHLRGNHRASGSALTLINNEEYLPITGSFIRVPQGSPVSTGGLSYHTSYKGGSGFDGGTNDGLSMVLYSSKMPVVSTSIIDDTSAMVSWIGGPAHSIAPTAIYLSQAGGPYSVVAKVAAGVTSYKLTGLTPNADFSVGVASAPNGVAPAGVSSNLAALPMSVREYSVTASSEIGEGIAANSNSGDVAIANPIVWAGSELAAAQAAGISVTNFMSIPPSGPTTYTYSERVTTSDDNGGGAAGEPSIGEEYGLSADQIIVAVEDGTDADYNDAYAEITVTPIG